MFALSRLVARQMGKVFVLFRHGPVHNPNDLVYGTLPGFSLEHGSDVVVRKAVSALELSLNHRPVAIVASPLLRSTQTARQLALCFGCAMHFDSRLAEVENAYQGLPRSDVLPLIRSGVSGDCESARDIADRMVSAVDDWVRRSEGVVVFVSHLLPIRLALAGFGCPAADLAPCGYHVLARAVEGRAAYRVIHSG